MRVPLPVPVADVIVSQFALLVTFHGHSAPALTVMDPEPAAPVTDADAGVSVKTQFGVPANLSRMLRVICCATGLTTAFCGRCEKL